MNDRALAAVTHPAIGDSGLIYVLLVLAAVGLVLLGWVGHQWATARSNRPRVVHRQTPQPDAAPQFARGAAGTTYASGGAVHQGMPPYAQVPVALPPRPAHAATEVMPRVEGGDPR